MSDSKFSDIRKGLVEFGLKTSDEELEAMLKLIEQPHPEIIIWAYTGAKSHSDYSCFDEIKCTAAEFFELLETSGLEYYGRFKALQRKGWKDWYSFQKEVAGQKGAENLASGLWYDIPECCARAFAERIADADERFYLDHPIEGFTSLDEWTDAKIAESGEGIMGELAEIVNRHLQEFGYCWNSLTLNENEEIETKVHEGIESGVLPESLYLLLGLTYLPCSAECENFIEKAERMYPPIEIFLGKEKADEIVERYRNNSDCC